MKELVQKLRDGKVRVVDVPVPAVQPGMVLVRNRFSVISGGTEGATVSAARKSLVGKAAARPEQAKQVVDVLRRQGPVQAFRAVSGKLDAYSPLGYSTAGEVVDSGPDVRGFAPGDLAACAGVGYANHAEYVAVPVNLCVKLHDGTDLAAAAYNTLGAIALQGVRRADLRLGESCGVVGLGLLGQLTCQLLRASGVRAVGVDIEEYPVRMAAEIAADLALVRSDPSIEDRIREFTAGLGLDAVIITAGSSSLDPINFAGSVTRKRGRVVVVGAVPTGFDRDPHYYRKELDLRMSCSYGPGRYDPQYEERGLDYPAAYVRWTEKRNMVAFQELLHSGAIDPMRLTTHRFTLEEAPRAYEMILQGAESWLGILLSHDAEHPPARERITVERTAATAAVGLGFIGAGSYARSHLLPNLPEGAGVARRGVVTRSGASARRAAERFNFEYCASTAEELLGDDRVNTVFIATRHDSHARLVVDALEAGKHVFVEKPLCLTAEELSLVEMAWQESGCRLMVGFNRRFSRLARSLKEKASGAPAAMVYRVNAGRIPVDSWIQDSRLGGGRIIGEACHFIDFLTFLSGALPVRVSAAAVPDPQQLDDTLSVTIGFADGSIGTVHYLANGASSLDKEYVELHRSGNSGVIRDFKSLELYLGRRSERRRLMSQDKGQDRMVRAFVEAVQHGGEPPIPPEEIFAVMRATFAVTESLRTRRTIEV